MATLSCATPLEFRKRVEKYCPQRRPAPAPQSGSDRDCIGPGKYESVENAVNPSLRVPYPARIVLQLARQLARTSDTNSLTRQSDAHTSHTLLHTPFRRPVDPSENEDGR